MRRNSVAFQLCKFSGSLAILLAALAGGSDLRAAESLQAFVSHLMQGKAGAVIVSDPRTGRILAIVESARRIQRSLHSRVDSEVSGERRRPRGGHHLAFGKNPVPPRPAASGRILSLLPSACCLTRSIWPGRWPTPVTISFRS